MAATPHDELYASDMSPERREANRLLAEIVAMVLEADRRRTPQAAVGTRVEALVRGLDPGVLVILREGMIEVFGERFRRAVWRAR